MQSWPTWATLIQTWPDWAKTVLGASLQLVLIFVVAVVVRHTVHRIVDRIAEGIATGSAGLGRLDGKLSTATAILGASPLLSARREQRARTTASVLKSATTATVSVVALLTALPLLNIPIAPLLASASVLGVALGLGAQALVKDFLGGLFMMVEDQYGVGDLVDLGPATGTVESIGLRVTRLRDPDGAVWYVRNGEVSRVGNRSQGWARAVLDVSVERDQDLGRVESLLLDVARSLGKDGTRAGDLLGEPELWGPEAVSKDAVALRLVVRTAPTRQWEIARELRRRVLDRFTAEDLPLPVGLETPGPT
jgi:small-conductance mechanosensitive channel